MSERPVENYVLDKIEFEDRVSKLFKSLSRSQKLTFSLYLGGLNTQDQADRMGVSRSLIARDLKNIKIKASKLK